MRPALLLLLLLSLVAKSVEVDDHPFGMINKVQTYCEFEALRLGSSLSDAFNMYDENTEWDMRLHSEYLTEHLGFSPWMQGRAHNDWRWSDE